MKKIKVDWHLELGLLRRLMRRLCDSPAPDPEALESIRTSLFGPNSQRALLSESTWFTTLH